MATNYLRRPPKPVVKKMKVRKTKDAQVGLTQGAALARSVEITPEERAALAESLAYFCVACGREHPSGSVRHDDVACAEAEIVDLIRRAQ